MTGRPTWKSADGKSWKRSRRYGGDDSPTLKRGASQGCLKAPSEPKDV